METIIPFPGTYYTCYSPDYLLSNEEDIDEIDNTSYLRCLGENYTKAFQSLVAKVLPLKLEFKVVISPNFYNYETDRIFAETDQASVNRLWKYCFKRPDFKTFIEDFFKSYPGFISFYDNDFEVWRRKDKKRLDHNEIGAMLSFLVKDIPDYEAIIFNEVRDIMV